MSGRRFCVLNICFVEAQTKRHLGNTNKTLTKHGRNTEETLTLNFSVMFPLFFCYVFSKHHVLETQKLRLGSKKCFAFFSFGHLSSTVSYIDTKCLCSTSSRLRRSLWPAKNVSEQFQSKSACQAMFVLVAKRTSTLD